MSTPGWVPINRAAMSMGLSLEEAIPFSVQVNGETVVAESVMRSVAERRNAAGKEEHAKAARGEISKSECIY